MKKTKISILIIVILFLILLVILIFTICIPLVKDTNEVVEKSPNNNLNDGQQQNNDPSSISIFNVQQDFRNIAEAVLPSIVTISSKELDNIENPYLDTKSIDVYIGSGVIVTENGYIVTANHLIPENDSLYVYLTDNRVFIPKIVGRYEKADISLLKINSDKGGRFPTASLGESNTIRIGDLVMAIGNPFGLKNSTTFGIVGSPNRKPKFSGSTDNPDLYYIQTDALITKGNSGGALVNIQGQVIGINVSVLGFGEEQSIGIGFAVPISYVKRIIQNLALNKPIDEVYTGIITSDDIIGYNKHLVIGQEDDGVSIASVYRFSPAYKEGIQRGDILLSVNDNIISDGVMFHNIISGYNPDERVEVEIERDGIRQTKSINVAKKPENKIYNTDFFLGMLVGGVDFDYIGLDLPEKIVGVVVVGVEEGSPSDKSSIREGNIITQIDYNPIQTIEEYNKVIKNIDRNKSRYLLTIKKYTHGIETESKSVYIENK